MNNEFETNGAAPEEKAEAEMPQVEHTEAPQEPVAVPEPEDPWAVFREDGNDTFPNPFAPKKDETTTDHTAENAGTAQTPPQGYAPYASQQGGTPPQGYVPPYGYAPPQGYVPPYGYAPPQGYAPPYGYVPPQGYAPQPNPAYGAAAQQNAPKKGGVGQALMWIAAILIEAVIVCFAIYGVYALATRDDDTRRPSYGQNSSIPSMPDRGDSDKNSSSNGSASSESGENPTDVQMGIVCGQMREDYAEYYGLEVGLVVQSFASDSPAQDSGLKIGDVITSANGVRVKAFEELFAVMQEMKAGDEMKLECYRLEKSAENIWGFKASEPFTVTFKMQPKHDDVSSAPSTPMYPGA